MVIDPRYEELDRAADAARRNSEPTIMPTSAGLGRLVVVLGGHDGDAELWLSALLGCRNADERADASRPPFRPSVLLGTRPSPSTGWAEWVLECVVPLAWAARLGVPVVCACGAELEAGARCDRCTPADAGPREQMSESDAEERRRLA